MHSGKRSGLAAGLVLAMVASLLVPGPGVAAGPTATIAVSLDGVACNPGGHAGIQATGTATVSGGTLGFAQLYAGEFRTVGLPYAPFDQGGWTVSSWVSYDSFKRGSAPAAETRTLDTTDPLSWNSHSYAGGIWDPSTGSHPDAWWIVGYIAYAGSRGSSPSAQVQKYVDCATLPPTVVDAASLTQVVWATETGLR